MTRAAPAAPACARTTDVSTPAAAPAAPCWTEVSPYPFGTTGEAVDPAGCEGAPGPNNVAGDNFACYLTVDSMAFRAWNRGLAATSTSLARAGDLVGSTPFGVWLFNGTRWFADPTFPGQAVCAGNKVLWAGKLDYWLVGARPRTSGRPSVRDGNWPAICRFDGVNFAWVPLSLPASTLARVDYFDATGPQRKPGAITSGACIAWDDCTFFGDYGAVVHWDGNALSDASPQIAASPWLATDYTAANARSGGLAGPVGVAVGTSGGVKKLPDAKTAPGALPAQPDGAAPPQSFVSRGGPFAPLRLPTPTNPQPGDPYRTDLVAADADADGRGWVAGNPVGTLAGLKNDAGVRAPVPPNAFAGERRIVTPEPSPLVPLSGGGSSGGCTAPPPTRFEYMPVAGARESYAWSSLAVFPGTGDALAGGQMRPAAAPASSPNDDGEIEPTLVRVTCGGTVSTTRFRVPDPTVSPPGAPLIPADRFGTVTSVAANAINDAWGATTQGELPQPDGQFARQRPRLYRLTDGRPPLAPAGDDAEARPLIVNEDPPRFVDPPPEPDPPPVGGSTIVQQQPGKTIRRKAPVYAISVSKHPKRISRRRFVIYVTFRVRRPVTIGVQALRGRRVVGASGLKRFEGKRGRLALKLDTRHWPTRLRFVTPKPAKNGSAIPPVSAGGRP